MTTHQSEPSRDQTVPKVSILRRVVAIFAGWVVAGVLVNVNTAIQANFFEMALAVYPDFFLVDRSRSLSFGEDIYSLVSIVFIVWVGYRTYKAICARGTRKAAQEVTSTPGAWNE